MSFLLPKNKNILLFYVLTVLNNPWFIAGNWIFFWLKYMNYAQLGVVDATCFAFGMFMEVPTGAISDLVGKKNTLTFALALSALGFWIISPATSLVQIFIGFLITQAGWAFYSGAAEALAFDTLKEEGQESKFEKVIATSNSLSIISTVVCTLVGILMYEWYFRLPHFGVAIAYTIGFFFTFFLKEPKIDTDKFSMNNYLHQLTQGFHQLLQPALKRFMLLIFILLGVYYMFSYGFIKPAISEFFGYQAREQGIVLSILSILSAFLVKLVPYMRSKLSDAQGLIILTILLGAGFILVGFLSGIWGFIALTLIISAGSLASPWVSIVVNREIPSQYRATTLSTIAMMSKVPYILAAVIAGSLIQNGFLVQFCLVVGGVILFVVLVSGATLMKRVNIS